ncbi:hypothetical protein B0H16DRAFT_1717502 [Mycena metata]|uniref:Uncharacterized protein n=1 Tax=Mycena metata TaxID=1033252 RepID=A0AAD7JJ47_9AGAR|nr:hypothetical protein B0H16DRAFT_1717502 [Mycena metata]
MHLSGAPNLSSYTTKGGRTSCGVDARAALYPLFYILFLPSPWTAVSSQLGPSQAVLILRSLLHAHPASTGYVRDW